MSVGSVETGISLREWSFSRALHVVFRNALVYRRTWRSSLFFSFLQPLLFLVAMGVGLGALIKIRQPGIFEGVSYLDFIAPGVLAGTCMQAASFDASFGTVSKTTWRKNYDAMLAAPLTVTDLLVGELIWLGLRMTMITGAFLLVISFFGIPVWPTALLAFPACVLTGVAFAAVIIGYSAKSKSFNDLSWLFRFVVTPLFLFSGTFFPVERMPAAFRAIAYATPLFHGVRLVRGSILASLPPARAVPHVLYLLIFLAVGIWYARRTLGQRLEN